MKRPDNSRQITDLLKSVTILVVMLGHYAQYMGTDYYDSWFRGYAFGAVAVFFVLAGYGAFFSLEKRSDRKARDALLPGYYLNRASRIYPAYWVALLLTASYYPEYEMLYELDPHTVAVYLGLPFVNAPGIFWFVPAIVLCYLLAPFIYKLLGRLKTNRYLALLLATVPVSLAVSYFYLSSAAPETGIFTWSNLNILFYKDYFLSNVLLFSLGMTINKIAPRPKASTAAGALVVPAALFFALMLYLTRDSYSFYDQAYELYLVLLAPVFVVSCFALCLTAIASAAKVPFSPLVGSPGRYSYQLYLFHMLYIALLARFDLVADNDPVSLLVFLALLPVLVLIFKGIDYAFNHAGDADAH